MATPISIRLSPHRRWRSLAAWVWRLRLGSGLILMAYLTTHLLNHALGLVSLEAMETGREVFLVLWRNPVSSVALYGALLTHLLLALWALYRRRRLRMTGAEWLQLSFGLLIPPLLITHVVGTRLAHEWFDVADSYTYVVLALWTYRPDLGVQQSLVLLLAWIHGSLGLHMWLRLKAWYGRLVPVFFAIALLCPVLALLGFVQSGREVASLATDSAWLQQALRDAKAPSTTARQHLNQVRQTVPVAFGLLVGGTLVARLVRRRLEPRRRTLRITYPGNQQVDIPRGFSILEASRLFGIPHASVCGGRGRCSTCRVRITRGLDMLPPASPDETLVLERVGAPPGVRLACQLRPLHDLSVLPLLPPGVQASAGFGMSRYAAGQEQEIAVLFADLRGFTRLAEPKLPYDVVFFLNQYFAVIGEAIQGVGGLVNQFTGDGVMALFGLGRGPAAGCRDALLAASAMIRSLAALSQTLADELPQPLRMGIGIHAGPVVVGRMGYAEATYLTAVGDTVHVASRLEGLTKEYHCQMVLSEQAAGYAGIDVHSYPRHHLTVRNRTEPLVIYVVEDVHQVAAQLSPGPATAGETL